MYLEPHLAAYLFPNAAACGEKDSDNDSGTGEEITSPDEFDPVVDTKKFDFKTMAQNVLPKHNTFEQRGCGGKTGMNFDDSV